MMILMLMMMVQESVKMCLNVLKRPFSALYYKIISMYTTIDTSLNLLTGLLNFIRCMDTRKRLGNHDTEVGGQFDRNQKLTGILRQNTR